MKTKLVKLADELSGTKFVAVADMLKPAVICEAGSAEVEQSGPAWRWSVCAYALTADGFMSRETIATFGTEGKAMEFAEQIGLSSALV